MTTEAIAELLQRQRSTLHSGVTRSVAARRALLDRLETSIRRHEAALFSALKHDLGKSDFEAYSAEVGLVYREIRHARRRLARWSRPRRVRTDLYNLPGWSCLYAEPYGVCLIIAPWNYPVQLLLSPLVGAIAAAEYGPNRPPLCYNLYSLEAAVRGHGFVGSPAKRSWPTSAECSSSRRPTSCG